MAARRLIGYWRNEAHPEYPDPTDLGDESWDDDERHAVWAYLSSGTVVAAFMGFSPCRICGAENGAVEFTDGVYQWPEGLAHYVIEHAVRLPQEFADHVDTRLSELEAQTAELDWWLATTHEDARGKK